MEKRKNKNMFYTAIGVITLIVAITGATFAYFTATNSAGENVFTGNMASTTFILEVEKKTNVDETKGGLIPMTNSMVQRALIANSGASGNREGICVDDNKNAVCQIYKITVRNTGTASMFLDGYVTLTGGSGQPTDDTSSPTTMRWAQAFCTETNNTLTTCTTAGASTVRESNTSLFTWGILGAGADAQHDLTELKNNFAGADGVTTTATINGSSYAAINRNYIRTSKHNELNSYTQVNDVSSALVYNQYIDAADSDNTNDTGDSSTTYTDAQVYYIVVWLSETGTNQTAGSGGQSVPATGIDFFHGKVTFVTAQGNEITSTFQGYSIVAPNTVTP